MDLCCTLHSHTFFLGTDPFICYQELAVATTNLITRFGREREGRKGP